MKKITLFLVAIFAMVNVANAQRAWAYDLELTPSVDSYTFAFKAVTAGDATLVFYKEGVEAGTLNLGSVSAGDNIVTKTSEELLSAIGKAGDFTWGVKMSAGAIAAGSTLKQLNSTLYYNMMGIVADVNPESDYFGKVYMQMSYDGKPTYGTTKQTQGFFIFDPIFNLISTPNVGIKPTLPTGYTFDGTNRLQFHRVAIDPKTGNLAFCYSIANKPGVFSIGRNNLTGEVTNLLAGVTGIENIKRTNALCFDEDGALYIIADVTTVSTTGNIYKIVDGVATKLSLKTPSGKSIWIDEQVGLVSDGRGGLWVAQNRSGITDNSAVFHVNVAKDTVDFVLEKGKTYSDWFTGGNGNNCRGGIAYNVKENVLATHSEDAMVSLFKVTYDEETGVPTITKWIQGATGGKNTDAIAFDYAGDLYTGNSSGEYFRKFEVPTDNNTCTTPAKKSQVITLVSATPEHTVTINVNGNGNVTGANTGTYLEGTELTLTATPAEHHDFINWTGDITSTDNPLTITVNSDINITANFQEHTKYTITASAADNTMGYVTGGGTYYAGETVTLTAVAKSTYYFVNWSDGNTNATRTFPASANLTLTANFAKANPRAWAYDLKMVEEGDNYKFSFTATTAANATLLFLDKEGNELYAAHNIGAVAAGANTVSIEKTYFTQVKDVYWSVKMDGEAITAISEITDKSKGIYNFYLPQGVAVDNNPESSTFSKIYIAESTDGASDGGSARADNQKRGIFIYDQTLAELNPTSNVGIIPSNVTLTNTTRNALKRIAINPKTNEVAFAYNASPAAVWAVSTENVAGEATNLLKGLNFEYCNSLCFDENGILYIFDNGTGYPAKGSLYKIVNGEKITIFSENSKYGNADNSLASDGRGGLWIAQNRSKLDGFNQLAHVSVSGVIDFEVNSTTTHGFASLETSRGAMAYNPRENILAIGCGASGTIGVSLYQVTYDPSTGVPSLEYIGATPSLGKNVEGIAFDYAGDLYALSANAERFYKFTLPTADNICTVPAPKSQAIVKEIRHTVTTNTIGNGTVIGAGEYVAGETATLTASPAAHHQFVNWTFADATTSTDNPLTLVVNSDITVTAHFEPIQYTVVALTNDESKGTVTGAGTYDYGTEATLTATPKPGYKLLYWSDRTTENPRTITMTKNETISAYFVKEYAVEPTFTIEKVWENTNVPASTNNGYQAVGWDGKIYMKDRLNATINFYTETGTELYVNTDAFTSEDALKGDQPIAIDDAGNLIIRSGSGLFYNAPTQLTIYQKDQKTGKVIDFTLPATGRCDFISASGDIYSQEGGYVYFYCQNQTTVSRLYIKNGGATVEDIAVDKLDATLTKGSSQSHVFKNIFGDLITHTRADVKILQEVNVVTGAVTTMSLPDFKQSTLGGCSFELGGKELIAYNIAGTDYNSEWNLYNMTDKQFLSGETLYAKDKVSKNSAANWLNVQVVDENTAYIYQFCPTVAVAVWKVTMHEVVLRDTENNEELLTDLNGSTTNVSVYRSLTGGMYNTLCLPFNVNELTGTPLENATVWQYNGATVKGDGTSKEIFLDFAEVTSITAGEPYLVEPAEDIAAPMEFKNVTISVTNGNNVAQGAVTMHGILHPTELQANNKSILFLVENNNLAWANETANMNGMRAYFKVNEPSLLSARTRAYIRREPTVATDMENITTSETEIKKVIYNGTLYIIRGDEVYTIQGTKVK